MSATAPVSPYTLLVVIHDSASELQGLLDSVGRHLNPRPPIVVVDNASHDDGAALALGQGAEVVTMADNAGFGAANNAGLARVSSPVTVLVNWAAALKKP